MRALIDTNILLFSVLDKEQLTKKVQDIIDNYNNELYIASESIREILELLRDGKIHFNAWKPAKKVIDYIKNETPITIKYAKEEHYRTYSELPWFEDHKDPRDRMIIAHAITEKLSLISSDTKFSKYVKYGLDWIYNNKG